jgi:hypothetical protein
MAVSCTTSRITHPAPTRGTPSLAETVKLFLMILILNPGRK